MVMAPTTLQMETSTQVNTGTENHMAEESTCGLLVQSMKVSSKTVRSVDKASGKRRSTGKTAT